jgi:hypothetical protein
MTEDKNRTSVLRQLAALQTMKLPELQEKWRDLYGTEPPNFKSTFLKKRLAYRIQELFYGGLSEDAKSRLAVFAGNDSMANIIRQKGENESSTSRRKILPGTRFFREWNDERYEVVALEKGFEYNGKKFRSLSAVAQEITGTKWNGRLFFGVTKRRY